tara:strand:- start:2036 stop:3112 length:1077 start_codon:yes stop_codon:yes gene_type:complete
MDNFCSRPFNELHIEENGNITPCCVMPSNRFFLGKGIQQYFFGKPLANLHEKFKHNHRAQECEYCWKAEDVNLKSHRINETARDGLRQIHIRLNNVCNFKCRMCNPKFSSTWEVENRKHNYFVHDYSIQKDVFDYDKHLLPFIISAVKSMGLKFINISGGEPLITDANFKLLNTLIANDATEVVLAYSTNLSNLNYKNNDLFSLWDKFNAVKLEASCDGWGSSVEYSRTGFKMKTFLTNFMKSLKYISRINCVVNIYSVWSLPYIEKLSAKFNKDIIYAPCFLPDFLNPQRLLKEDKEELLKIYSNYPRLLKVYEDYIAKDLPPLKEMVDYNLLLDKHRGTDFFSVFPQYRKYNDISC